MDLNSDLGEGFGVWRLGDDELLLDVVTSANVACGFHAGDPSILRRVCAVAAERGVVLGAQVSYRDLAGFGRRFLDVAPADLVDDVLYQVGALQVFAQVAGSQVAYVKPHGALYHAVTTHEDQAAAVVEAVRLLGGRLAVLGPPGSVLARRAAEAGLPVVLEAFADRGYAADGSLVPRQVAGRPVAAAVITDPDVVVPRAVRLATAGEVVAVDGTVVPLRARSLCVHGDTAGAVQLAHRVRRALRDAGVVVRPFADEV
ncbi:MAG: LamB/YcsF family protein [Angustibacter sp.]